MPAAPASELTALVAAIGRSLGERLDPQRLLDEFSRELEPLVPHDRLVVSLLDEDGRTFRILAEQAGQGPRLHEAHYTTAFEPEARYVVAEWMIRPVFEGHVVKIDDATTDPRLTDLSEVERRLRDLGIRSSLVVPLRSGGRVVGALAVTAFQPHAYTDAHVATARRIADLIGPFIETLGLLQRERRRRERVLALQSLPQALAGSLDVRDVFARLADAVRPVLDFDVIGAVLISPSGREVETLAEIDSAQPTGAVHPPARPVDDFSLARRLMAGEPIILRDAQQELDRSRPADREIIENGARASLIVPLMSGREVRGGVYLGKRRPDWYGADDVEIATAVAAQVMLMVQHQQLAEEQRRLALAEGRARRLEQRIETLRSELKEQYGFERVVGRAASLREALDRAARVAPTEATVLIEGESGTGKELVARAIHAASDRADGSFVAINCAAIPETLIESELFGHEKGAFTGAVARRPGAFEQAAGGTLFLDEVAELPPPVQAALLRVIQEREFTRVGGTQTVKAEVRLIAATNRELERMVAQGRFRHDLFYRLNVFPIRLPALRERGTDVLLLADHFVRTLGARMGKGDAGLSEEARSALLAHRWPGNIRELQNALERALIVNDGELITAGDLGLAAAPEARLPEASPRPGDPSAPWSPGRADVAPGSESARAAAGAASLPDVERRMVEDALRRAGGNRSRAAKLLGLTRSQLYTRLKRYRLGA